MDNRLPPPLPVRACVGEIPPVIHAALTAQEMADLRLAKTLLETPGFAARLTSLLGVPLEKGFQMLPQGWRARVERATHAALVQALKVAVGSLSRRPGRRPRNLAHKVMAGAVGGVGGAFGLPALAVELPISTTLILRSVAEIARSQELPLDDWSIRLACLEVFALGGPAVEDDSGEHTYWIVRAGLARAVSEAATYLSRRGAVSEGAPVLVRLVSTIASRFGVIVSEELAAKTVPVLGAAAGSAINVAFMNHFQNMALGHFIMKRLERKHGVPGVREAYQSLAVPFRPPPRASR